MVTKNVVVAGGAGFLGSHAVDELLKQGKRVIIIDDFSTSSEQISKHLLGNPMVQLLKHDIVEPCVFTEKIDEVYNFACPASPVHYQKDPIRTVKINVLGTINLLEIARQHNAVFFQASTSEIYGNPLIHPQVENYLGNVNTIGPRACYDEGKRCAETLCFDYARQYGVGIKVVRIFNTYGPRMSAGDGRVIPNFITQALSGAPLTVYGTGEQTRSFCYVDDLIRGILAFVATSSELTGPVNIGNPNEITMLTLVQEIIRLTGSKSAIEFKPLPHDDPERRRPDIVRIQSLVGWKPLVDLSAGLTKTIEYFRHN